MDTPDQNLTAALRNKALLRAAHAESIQGRNTLFGQLLADDVTFFQIGTTSWSKTYVGKQAVQELFQRLYALLDGPHLVEPQRFIAEDDLVVVEARGRSMTKAGKPYHNQYCIIYRLADGKIREITEYCDTALIDAVL